MKRSIVIWGAGGHANVVVDAVGCGDQYRIEALVDDVGTVAAPESHGIRIVRDLEQLRTIRAAGVDGLHVAIGACAARARIAGQAQALGFELVEVRHPTAIVSPRAEVAAGAFLAAGSIVGPTARIGTGVIVNTRASVDHDCEVGAWSHIAPGATLGGRVAIGRETWIGIGASVRDGVRIGARTMIGAGAVVLRDIADDTVAFGVPARAVRTAG